MSEEFFKNRFSDTRILFCGLLVVLTAVSYFHVLNLGFLIMDDSIYVTANQQVQQGLTPKTIRWAFTTVEAEFWHPLTWLSLMMDVSIYGMLPRGFHSTNLLLHIGATLFLFLAFDGMSGQRSRSFFLAALFAVHPLHVEAVAWIAERKEILCGFFWCAGLYAYTAYAKKPDLMRYLLVFSIFCMGLMSKPMIITFPFLLLLLDFWPLQRFFQIEGLNQTENVLDIKRFASLIAEKMPFFILTAGGVALTVYAQNTGQGIVGTDIYSMTDRIANALNSYGDYLWKTILPVNLSVFYPFRVDFSVFPVIFNASILVVISAITLLRIQKNPYLFTGWCWFIGTLIPVIGIVKIGDFAMADRYMYMPIAGIFIALIWLCSDIFKRFSPPKAIPVVLSSGLIFWAAAGTWNYLDKWQTSESLFRHAAHTAAPNYFAHYTLGHIYARNGQYDRAEQEFQKAVDFRADKSKLYIDLGRAIGAQGDFALSIPQFEKVLKKKQNNRDAHFYMGLALTGAGNYEAAWPHFLIVFSEKNFKKVNSKLKVATAPEVFKQMIESKGINTSAEALKQYFIKGFNGWQKTTSPAIN